MIILNNEKIRGNVFEELNYFMWPFGLKITTFLILSDFNKDSKSFKIILVLKKIEEINKIKINIVYVHSLVKNIRDIY